VAVVGGFIVPQAHHHNPRKKETKGRTQGETADLEKALAEICLTTTSIHRLNSMLSALFYAYLSIFHLRANNHQSSFMEHYIFHGDSFGLKFGKAKIWFHGLETGEFVLKM
jgi:hypothetical protein